MFIFTCNIQCLVFLLLLLLSVKLLSSEFAAVSELSAEKFNGTLVNYVRLVCNYEGVKFLIAELREVRKKHDI